MADTGANSVGPQDSPSQAGESSEFLQRGDPPGRASAIAFRQALRRTLGLPPRPLSLIEVRVGRRWLDEGVVGEEVSWSVDGRPRTEAWVFKPADVVGRLPAVLALHDHGGSKRYGKEKVADGPDAMPASALRARQQHYGGRAFAVDLARRGVLVVCHDAFLWGSRRVPLGDMPARIRAAADDARELAGHRGSPMDDDAHYDAAASQHEHVVAKASVACGTSVAGLIAAEDEVALSYLLSRPDVDPGAVGAMGLSGGAARGVILGALCPQIRAMAVTCVMSTLADMPEEQVAAHSWQMFTPGLARLGDWPDVLASRVPAPVLVQFADDDHLHTTQGMKAADRRLREAYAEASATSAYRSSHVRGGHRFGPAQQDEAFAWLLATLGEPRPGAPAT